ncbi:MAG: 5-bromo-4-chloroindolyl phosphate hydrolysis family protein [Oscillospiraceae bacterium]|jgi:hypothetical protein|nr:5-bromo-4-chloroindolyl phosphate hydrolysis family protein [Oscillospiraceae bacterium]
MSNKNDYKYGVGRDARERTASSDAPSWIGIIICLFAFWPLGLLLLIGKMRSISGQAGAPGRAPHGETEREGARPGDTRDRPARESGASRREGGADDGDGARRKKKKDAGDRRRDGATSGLLLLMGIVLLSVCLALFLPPLGEAVSAGGFGEISRGSAAGAMLGAFFGVGGVLTLFARGFWRRRASKFRKYAAALGQRETAPISAIASATGFSERAVRRDIQAMIDSGWLESASYIDDGLGCFVRSSEAAQTLRRERERAAASVSASSGENEYMKIIVELRALNATIIDIAISDKIDRIETLTAKIFRAVEDDPSKLPQIRRFMSYYLPTTLKLLRSYSTLEKQGERGENISAAKESINGILDTLAVGFEQQLDKLFRSDAIDITSDINVLERMMASDGLTEAGPLSQTAAACKPAP